MGWGGHDIPTSSASFNSWKTSLNCCFKSVRVASSLLVANAMPSEMDDAHASFSSSSSFASAASCSSLPSPVPAKNCKNHYKDPCETPMRSKRTPSRPRSSGFLKRWRCKRDAVLA